jgi:hypothetical protein
MNQSEIVFDLCKSSLFVNFEIKQTNKIKQSAKKNYLNWIFWIRIDLSADCVERYDWDPFEAKDAWFETICLGW